MPLMKHLEYLWKRSANGKMSTFEHSIKMTYNPYSDTATTYRKDPRVLIGIALN
jgi:hypothetical protein